MSEGWSKGEEEREEKKEKRERKDEERKLVVIVMRFPYHCFPIMTSFLSSSFPLSLSLLSLLSFSFFVHEKLVKKETFSSFLLVKKINLDEKWRIWGERFFECVITSCITNYRDSLSILFDSLHSLTDSFLSLSFYYFLFLLFLSFFLLFSLSFSLLFSLNYFMNEWMKWRNEWIVRRK